MAYSQELFCSALAGHGQQGNHHVPSDLYSESGTQCSSLTGRPGAGAQAAGPESDRHPVLGIRMPVSGRRKVAEAA
jgi:hypothetical protein